MSEAVYQPTFVEEDVFATDSTPYDEFATFEVAAEDDSGRFQRFVQEYGTKVGTVVLAGVSVLGLTAAGGCDGKNDRPDRVKGMVIETGSQVTLGTCVKKKVAYGYGESDLRNAGLAKVRADATKTGCTSKLSGGGKHLDPCNDPTNAFVSNLRNGQIVVQKKTLNMKTNDFECSWTTR